MIDDILYYIFPYNMYSVLMFQYVYLAFHRIYCPGNVINAKDSYT